MDVDLSNLDEKIRFDVKLQISLYKTAEKVMREDKREEFENYMQERINKIREILGLREHFRIFEDEKLIFEV
ncbi:hypothetical protein [Candidatus Aciduliprofundum boonei]|uniref:Uncharacterized protein n=1 Tax=Aciduliprofundum boonei (strain DSM 19572 / T469) TaxID=439481 RepID=B5IDV1_ACIB4|nr:hypothetical protein [Candidatus Aciduliprofundum boonei]ADD08182.1 conserved hypothetical protein [Aciduliprofundum boonei T469]EDY35425.1 hypothetical protein ABOONEI_708 [Aciduliprofundum boonei T469]EDY35586.1 hypothetical protein ABOONEI_123 [Aciduliprofundum boonei T469]HII54556.1 hypothetical protein [Candidatus Aciduliprofundum boonei]